LISKKASYGGSVLYSNGRGANFMPRDYLISSGRGLQGEMKLLGKVMT